MAAIYRDIPFLSIKEIEQLFESGIDQNIINGILSISMHPIDKEKAIKYALKYIGHSNNTLKRVAIIALGHIARVYKEVDKSIILPPLEEIYNDLNEDKEIRGIAEDAISDVKMFTRSKLQVWIDEIRFFLGL